MKRELVNDLLKHISRWGYQEVATPLLEYYQVLSKGEQEGVPDHLYKLIDRDGSILALRPEMTTPIARVVSSRQLENPPWRLMYGSEVFRYEEIQTGRQRQFTQVGVELIGQEGAAADGEVLALAVETLLTLGVERFTISLGHTGILRGLLEGLAWEEEQLEQARAFILDKDFVGLNKILEQAGVPQPERESILDLLTRQMSREGLRQALQKKLPAGIRAALEELDEIIGYLEPFGYEKHVQIDLSTLRSQAYYTGMVFEAYTSRLGYPVGGGGRYDRLLHHFDTDLAATGFALGVERLLLSLDRPNVKDERLILAGADSRTVLQEAARLRSQSQAVIAFPGLSREQAAEQARKSGLQLRWLDGGNKNGI